MVGDRQRLFYIEKPGRSGHETYNANAYVLLDTNLTYI